ncbi:branched-chain amino acid ABC transporter permease [Variovorax paradoxus]|jgi:branched-chain amino acid transport system permease protein|uniref:branched-chain amino acid ABC transporter permease n=1 Tax=Variovorax paradoxus TaxID=34073 RepID=UPI00399B7517
MRRNIDIAVALGIVVALPLLLSSGSLASEVLIYALAVLGCNLLLGYTGLLSFGQGIFFGLGSYTFGLVLTRTGLPMPLALVASIILGGLAAGLVGIVSIRQKGTYFVMLTLAFAQMFYFLAYSVPSLTGGDNGLLNIPRPPLSAFGVVLWDNTTAWQFYAMVAVIFLLVFVALHRVTTSIFGRTLLAIRDNEVRASAVGYNVPRFKLLAFVLSGAVTALAGALNAMMVGVAPLANAEFHVSEMILVMTVIGGAGNLAASLIGALFYVLAADWLSTLWPRWLMLLGVLLVIISLGMQRGLWGLIEDGFLALTARFKRTGEIRVEEKQV